MGELKLKNNNLIEEQESRSQLDIKLFQNKNKTFENVGNYFMAMLMPITK